MSDFDDINQLYKHLQKSLKDSTEETAKGLEVEVKEQIDNDIYSYNQKDYQRTYQLRDSVTSEVKENSKSFSINIFHDTNKITPGTYNQHRSIISGEDVSSMIPTWITSGSVPNIFNNSSYPWMYDRDYFTNAEERFKSENTIENLLSKALNKRGIDTK